MHESGRRALSQYTGKAFVFSLAGLCLAGLGVWFGYQQFFTKGLERLPSKVCEKTVQRDMVTRVLPEARSAQEGSRREKAGSDLTFSCHVVTSDDASLLGKAEVRPVSRTAWLKSYRGAGGEKRLVRVSADGVEALARVGDEDPVSAVYVPCTPPTVPPYNASEEYAVATEVTVSTYGKAAAVTGAALRQTLTDIAYRLTEHAYRLAECKAPRDFPEELPRYAER
nr:hypothetical protein StreXyl84_37610 [Streptomyces sp. Xyl84]